MLWRKWSHLNSEWYPQYHRNSYEYRNTKKETKTCLLQGQRTEDLWTNRRDFNDWTWSYLQRSHEEGSQAPLESTSNTKSTNTMNKTIKISAVHSEMLKGIMKTSGIRKEDEMVELMIAERYNTRRRWRRRVKRNSRISWRMWYLTIQEQIGNLEQKEMIIPHTF